MGNIDVSANQELYFKAIQNVPEGEKLSDEDVWLFGYKLFMLCPDTSSFNTTMPSTFADNLLKEFNQRFRNGN